MVKQNEIENEQKDKICKFFAYDLPCPDQIEFKECQYQHDDLIKQIHILYNEQDPDNEGKIANSAYKLLIQGTNDNDVINMRKKLLRYWPEKPTRQEKYRA